MIRSEMWAFKGKYFWRISRPGQEFQNFDDVILLWSYRRQWKTFLIFLDGSNQRGDPVLLSAFWYGLPTDEVRRFFNWSDRTENEILLIKACLLYAKKFFQNFVFLICCFLIQMRSYLACISSMFELVWHLMICTTSPCSTRLPTPRPFETCVCVWEREWVCVHVFVWETAWESECVWSL